MKKFMSAVAVLAAMAGPGAALAQDDQAQQAALTRTVAALDTAVFDAFNTCSKPVQLEKHASFFAPDVEFYHDAGGVTWSRREMIENTQKYVCGHFRRELVPGTLKVFPISNYGAIEQRRRIVGRLQYRHDADGLFGRNRIGAIARDRVGQFRVEARLVSR